MILMITLIMSGGDSYAYLPADIATLLQNCSTLFHSCSFTFPLAPWAGGGPT